MQFLCLLFSRYKLTKLNLKVVYFIQIVKQFSGLDVQADATQHSYVWYCDITCFISKHQTRKPGDLSTVRSTLLFDYVQ